MAERIKKAPTPKRRHQYFDLQMHSHFSDGSKSPTELVELLRKKNIVLASLTDHNTIHGQYEFIGAAKKYNIKTVPGVELYARYKNRGLHILGYGIDINDPELHDALRETQHARKKRIESLVHPLKRRGLKLDISELFHQPSTYVGMVNVVRSLKKNPRNLRVISHVLKKTKFDYYEIYNAFFAKGMPTHLPEEYLPLPTVLGLIKEAGGIAVIAHPGQQLKFEDDKVIKELKMLGLKGIECFSSHHNWDQTAHYLMLADHYRMIATGGSDYHGDLPGDYIIENYYNYPSLPIEIYKNIKVF